MLKELYGSLDNYRALCERDTAIEVSQGFICAEDAQAIVDFAMASARERGLN